MKIFYDVDTQNDFMNRDGALYVPGAEETKPNLKNVTNYALDKQIAIIGSLDTHYGTERFKDKEGELRRNRGPFPDHCMLGSFGAKKIPETDVDGKGRYFPKQSYDIFTNPAFEVFLQMADVKEAVVYGVATDYCVKAAVVGMQKRGVQCYVVEDAISGVAPDTTKSALEEMATAGAKFVKTSDVLEGRVI